MIDGKMTPLGLCGKQAPKKPSKIPVIQDNSSSNSSFSGECKPIKGAQISKIP